MCIYSIEFNPMRCLELHGFGVVAGAELLVHMRVQTLPKSFKNLYY